MALANQRPPGTAVIVEEGPGSRLRRVLGGDHRRRSDRCRHHVASRRARRRHWPFVGLTLVAGQSLRDDLHAAGRRVAYHRAVAVIGPWRLFGRPAANQMGRDCIPMRFSSATLPTASSPGRSPRFWSPPSRPPRFLRPSAPQRKRFRMLPAARHPVPHRPRPISRRFRLITSSTRCSGRDQPDANASPQDARAEAGRILARSIANGNLDPGDHTYLAKLIAARTGISQQDAEKRIDDTMNQMKAADGQGKAGSRCGAQGLGNSLLLSVLLDADRRLHRLRRRRDRRPAARRLKRKRGSVTGPAFPSPKGKGSKKNPNEGQANWTGWF